MFRSEAMRRLARLMHVAAAYANGAALGLEMHSALVHEAEEQAWSRREFLCGARALPRR